MGARDGEPGDGGGELWASDGGAGESCFLRRVFERTVLRSMALMAWVVKGIVVGLRRKAQVRHCFVLQRRWVICRGQFERIAR